MNALDPSLTSTQVKTWKAAQTNWAKHCATMMAFARTHHSLCTYDNPKHREQAEAALANPFCVVVGLSQTPTGLSVNIETFDGPALRMITLYWGAEAMKTLMYRP